MAADDFASIVQGLVEGKLPADDMLAALGGLDRGSAAVLRAAWGRIPDETRRSIVFDAAVMAEGDIGLDFERLMTIALDDREADVRRAGAAALYESTSRDVARKLADMTRHDPDPAVRAAAVSGLAAFLPFGARGEAFAADYREVLEAIRVAAAAHDEAPEVRARALVAIAAAGEPAADQLISEALYSDDSALRLAAIEAMGQSCDEQWLEYVLEQFEAEDPEFRVEAAVAAGEIGSEDAIDPLAALAGDPDQGVADAAVRAIGSIGGPLAIECLTDLKADPPVGIDLDVLGEALAEAREAMRRPGEDDY